ncbi:MAG: hypothetical protein Q8Q09_19010 [Deltaproteobacteria bacterium]|nr:hypothetical protein [Deltaproteobacteria bacterium]
MNRLAPRVALFATLFALGAALGACGTTVNPNPDGSAPDGGRSDGGLSCRLNDGTQCPAGTSCPAGDGCNTCSCPAGGGNALCTLIACGQSCLSARDCSEGEFCEFTTNSCAPGTRGRCMRPSPCFRAETYCSCTGETYQGCSPSQPTVRVGACDGPIIPPGTCSPTIPCSPGNECVYPVNVCPGTGSCSPETDCAAIAPFCGCDGMTFQSCPGRPTRPARSAGPCGG